MATIKPKSASIIFARFSSFNAVLLEWFHEQLKSERAFFTENFVWSRADAALQGTTPSLADRDNFRKGRKH